MNPNLIAKVEVPTTVKDEAGEPRNAIGTAYPLRDRWVITARHVLYPKDKDGNDILLPEGQRVLSWRYGNAAPPYHYCESSTIEFECEKTDIALLKADTPEGVQAVIPCFNPPIPKSEWESMGYSKGGKLIDRLRNKVSADGAFLRDTNDHVQHLKTGEGVKDVGVWKGMSGAPVFRLGTNELAGVITKANDNFPERLMMTSVAWLLAEGNCPGFRGVLLEAKCGARSGPECDTFIENYFRSVAEWLRVHKKARVAILKQLPNNGSGFKDCPVVLVDELKSLPIPELIDLISDARNESTDPVEKSELVAVFKRLLPAFYETDYTFSLLNQKKSCEALIGIPYATQVSAEVLMAASDQRDVDFIFHSISSKNTTQTAYPGKYRLGLPPESGSTDVEGLTKMLDEDLIGRFGLEDFDSTNAEVLVDDYLYRNIAKQSRLGLSSTQKVKAVQRTLKRLAGDDDNGTYYWLFSSESKLEDKKIWRALATNLDEKYPEISCLQLEDNFDKELDEDDLFDKLHKILIPEPQ